MLAKKTEVVKEREGFPEGVYLRLRDLSGLESLAGTAGANTPAELVDLALSALEWVVENRMEGKRIYATDASLEGAIPPDASLIELLVPLKDVEDG